MSTCSSDSPVVVKYDMREVIHHLLRKGNDEPNAVEGLEMFMDKMTSRQDFCKTGSATVSHQQSLIKEVERVFGSVASTEGLGHINDEDMKKLTKDFVKSIEKATLEAVELEVDPFYPQPCKSIMQYAKDLCKEGLKRLKRNGEDYEEAVMFVEEVFSGSETRFLEQLLIDKCKRFAWLAGEFKRYPHAAIQIEKDMKTVMLDVLGPLIGYIEGMMMTVSPQDRLPAELRIAVYDLVNCISDLQRFSQNAGQLGPQFESEYTQFEMDQLWDEFPGARGQRGHSSCHPLGTLMERTARKILPVKHNESKLVFTPLAEGNGAGPGGKRYKYNPEASDCGNYVESYIYEWELDRWDQDVLRWNLMDLAQIFGLSMEFGICMLHAFNDDVDCIEKYLRERDLIKSRRLIDSSYYA